MLKETLSHSCVSVDELTTLLVEVEAVVNDRPVTYLSSDAADPDPLTPAYLIYGRRITGLPLRKVAAEELSDPDFGLDRTQLCQESRHLEYLISQCWGRWRDEYLPTLH